ncbi:helix-turn-helix transcriptional regulator [Chelatococcus sambhunathii]|uniref:Helix-turn-helix transcriptional regulator n=2 Tax=Chelatococcus sambhunathii TaxID=363953 RepID=A0ABU1DH45_9HYPH|nr:helix-turn-helix transcriptional regulator [Chelatococcus sambhunathii]
MSSHAIPFGHWGRRPWFASSDHGDRACGSRFRGGPFGRHRGGPFGGGPFGRGGGGRMFDAGALRLVVLGLLAEAPRHGYDVIKALEARFRGTYSPSPGSIYPMLQMMEDADLAVSETQGNKRLYSITDAGRAYLEENRAELDKINAQLDETSDALGDVALGEVISDLRRVLFEKLRDGRLTGEQAAKAREILNRAARDLRDL